LDSFLRIKNKDGKQALFLRKILMGYPGLKSFYRNMWCAYNAQKF